MNEILSKIHKIGIVPVVVLNDAKDAKPLAKALCDGGLPCAEVTFRTEAAEESIRIMSESFPEMLVGAGTVLTEEQVDRAAAAGAKFIVSPGLNPKVVAHCIEKGIPVTPGTCTPSDIEKAIELGLEVVKFFPAEASGGLSMIKALSGPYPKMKFMPTGGINPDNMCSYLANSKILACGGSWMVKESLIKEGDFDTITEKTKEAVMKMLGFEITKSPFLGAKGHLAIGTNNLERAVDFLQRQGYEFAEETSKYKDGQLKSIYLKGEFGGFAIHLVEK